MDRDSDYIKILIESLNKKVEVLDGILKENEKQKSAVSEEKINDALFEETLENKEKYINELNNLDIGFETVYNRVRDVLQDEKSKSIYGEQIRQLKDLIGMITDRTLEIQRQEKSNEQLVMKKLAKERSEITQVRNARKAASDYYKSMNKVNYIDPQFMDRKQ
ncbi:MAG: flagellar protein FliT [Lachnospiraceae bacterium]|nr:flagellar protein FliT [Lachnospiraceae bacterium]MDE6252029.1 flagellar protein FliT [Lachnospiraceae bacterium]